MLPFFLYQYIFDDGGYRTFPEKAEPDSPIYNKVEVKITLAKEIPDGMWANVYVAWFDPNNPIGSTKTPGGDSGNVVRDNHGSIELTLNNPCVGFDDLSGTSSTRMFTIGPAHAGDNYIVAAHPNNDVVDKYVFESKEQYSNADDYGVVGRTLLYPEPSAMFGDHTELPKNLQTSVLTVWRTLNAECDQMAYYLEETSTELFTPPNPAVYFGLATSELARACVVINAIFPNTPENPNQPPDGSNPMEPEEIENMLNNGRDLFGNSQQFWTVRMIMTSDEGENDEGEIAGGGFRSGWNTITIYYELIKKCFDEWIRRYPDDKKTVTEHDVIARVILHEICHLLIDKREDIVYFDDSGNATSVLSMVGVRSTILRGIPGNSVVDMHNSIKYSKLLDDDIQDIQFYSRAR